MTHNLLTPFMLSEAGITINEAPKIPHPQRITMQSHSKKPIFEFHYHYMAHSPIFPPASQVFKNWKNQWMFMS